MTDENTPNGASASNAESKTNTNSSSSSGNANGGSRKNQRNGGGAFKGASNGSSNRYPNSKFEGRCDELKGYVYDLVGSRSADPYTRTTKEIGEYVGRAYGNGADARLAVLHLKAPKLTEPSDLASSATATQKRIWEKKIDEFVKRVGFGQFAAVIMEQLLPSFGFAVPEWLNARPGVVGLALLGTISYSTG